MPNTRQPYSPEFRFQILYPVRSGRDPSDLARGFDPSAQATPDWVVQVDLAGYMLVCFTLNLATRILGFLSDLCLKVFPARDELQRWHPLCLRDSANQCYAEYLKKQHPQAKVAMFYLNTDFGQNFLAGFKAAIADSSIQLMDAKPHNYSDPTVDKQLTNLRASGADTLLVATVPKPAAQAVRFATESGWKPLTIVTYAAALPVALGPAGIDNLQGLITGQFLKPLGSPDYANDAGIKRYLADYDQFKPRFDRGDTLGQMGYLIGEATVAVLQAMKAPTGEAALEAARHMAHVELSLLLPGITLNTDGTTGPFAIESMQLFTFKGDGYTPASGVISYEGKTPRL